MTSNSRDNGVVVEPAPWQGVREYGLEQTATDLPFWGDQIRFDGIGLQRCTRTSIEVAFQIPDHVFWFHLSPAQGTICVNGTGQRHFEIEGGMSGFIGAGSETYIRTVERADRPNQEDVYLRMAVAPERLEAMLALELDGRAAGFPTIGFPECIHPEHVKALTPIGETLDRIFQYPDQYTSLYAELLVDTFLLRAALHWSDKTTPVENLPDVADHRFHRVADFIEAHLEQKLRLEDLCQVAGLSPFHFARGFKDVMGLPPHAYVTKRRINRARHLLKDQDLSLAAIAARCGFSSQSHFTTIFRRAMGMTPARYRKEWRL